MTTLNFRNNVRVEIVQDNDPEMPEDDIFQITYKKGSRHTLGTEAVTNEEFENIREAIAIGRYVGMPVYAYVHSGSTIATTPFSCPWDSWQSGFIYAPRLTCVAEFGKKRFTKKVQERAIKYAEGVVKDFNSYLTGDVWGAKVFVGEEEKESVWGFIGATHAREEAEHMGLQWEKQP